MKSSLFSGMGYWLSAGRLCERTQACKCVPHRWNVTLRLCNDYHSLLSHWCKWCTIIQWMKAGYLRGKKLLLIIYCFKKWGETRWCVVMASTCFLLVSEWILLQSSITEIYYVSKWCTLWECLLCAVTCCRILCMESVEASKHVTGIPLLRAM